MQAGVSTASLFLRETNEDALVVLDKIDAKVVEIFLESFCEYTDDFARLLKSRLGNLRVHSVHTLNTHFEPELFSLNDRAYSDAHSVYQRVLSVAKILDAKNYTFHGQIRLKRGPKVFTDYAYTGGVFEKLCREANECGVSLCLENVEWAIYSRAGYLTNIKPYCPALSTCLDIKQARIAGDDYKDYLAEMKNSLKTVHISDYTEDGKIVLPGKGLFDFRKLIDELNKANYDGPLIIEVYKDSFTDLDELSTSLEYIRKLIKEG